MIAAIAFALALGVQDSVGTFRHGPWQGQCFRKGSLHGTDREHCLAWAPGPVTIRIQRTADLLAILATPEDCKIFWHAEGAMIGDMTGQRDRATLVASMIRDQARIAIEACGSKLEVPEIAEADLEALLRETDNLAGAQLTQEPEAQKTH